MWCVLILWYWSTFILRNVLKTAFADSRGARPCDRSPPAISAKRSVTVAANPTLSLHEHLHVQQVEIHIATYVKIPSLEAGSVRGLKSQLLCTKPVRPTIVRGILLQFAWRLRLMRCFASPKCTADKCGQNPRRTRVLQFCPSLHTPPPAPAPRSALLPVGSERIFFSKINYLKQLLKCN